jgi:GMP synthase (glutamine-hydrolysing)
MAQKVILIHHGDSHRKDRAADQLEQLGYDVQHFHLYSGDTLPAFDADVAGTVIYGGKYCITDIPDMPFLQDEIRWLERCMAAGLPVLGMCQGAQMIAHILGAEVGPLDGEPCEFGYYELETLDPAFMPEGLRVPQAHFHGFGLPDGATLLARSAGFPNQAFRFGERTYGFQFHPEVTKQMFQDWQDAPWTAAHTQRKGVQSRAEQDALADEAQTAVDPWFRDFLTKLFGPAS